MCRQARAFIPSPALTNCWLASPAASSTELRGDATFVGQRGQEAAVDDLTKIYEADGRRNQEAHPLRASQHHSQRAAAN